MQGFRLRKGNLPLSSACNVPDTAVSDLNLTVRFLRHGTDEGIPCVESEIGHQEREWSIPAEQSAVVLVDCWAEHFIQSHE